MFADVNGTRLFYETDGSGPPLMLVHGAPGLSDHRANTTTHGPLADQFQLVYFDLRGCGQSARMPVETYTHEHFARDVEGLRQHLGLAQMALLGRSYGGFIALEYALRFHHHLTHLILADTAAWHGYDDVAQQTALAANLPGVDRQRMQRMFAGQVRDIDEFRATWTAMQPLYFDQMDADRARERARHAPYVLETHNAVFSREFPRYDVRRRLHEIRVPTLVMVGRHDWITPVAAAEELAAGIPGARLVIFEHSGHSPQVEESEAYLRVVREFVTAKH